MEVAGQGRAAASASAPGKVLVAGGFLGAGAPQRRPSPHHHRSLLRRRPPAPRLAHPRRILAWTDVKVTSPRLSREVTFKLSPKKSTLQSTSSRQFSVAAAEVTVADKEGKDALDKLCFCKVATIFYSYREQIEARGLPLTPDQKYCFRCLHSVQLHLIQKLLMELWNNDWSKPEVAKTGLGSSAAMTTSIVAALLHYLGAVNSAAARDLDLLHAVLMQFPH
uniref:phosphomevalonate kinase n=1 Tax=Oryza meridionalis TaxID=40149 RepID=A0A0E0D4Q1_9ORYZ